MSTPARPAQPALLTITGALVLQGTSNVNIDLLVAGQDRLVVTGAGTLAGTLNVSREGAYVPGIGSFIEIMSYSSQSASFGGTTGVGVGFNGDRQFSINTGDASKFRLEVTAFP